MRIVFSVEASTDPCDECTFRMTVLTDLQPEFRQASMVEWLTHIIANHVINNITGMAALLGDDDG